MKKAGRRKEWFDNEKFWRETYPFMFPDSRIAGTDEEIGKVLRLASPEGKAALDLCCGPGRGSIALARRGFSVTGVDLTRYLLDKARASARAAHVKIKWIQKDMRDYVSPESFDLAISMFSSIGYFDDRDQDLTVLTNLFTSLRPRGKCLLELMGRECLAKVFQPTASQKLPDGATLVERREIVDDWTRIQNEWIVIRNGRTKHFTLPLNLYSGQELRDKMRSIGFSDVTLYGSLDGEAYGPSAKRLIAIGTRSS